jgi:hypothetical protein
MRDSLRTGFLVHASLMDRFLFWVHGVRFRTLEIMPTNDGALHFECSCGGHAQVRRRDDGSADVEIATCRRGAALIKLQRLPLPRATALP